MAPFFAELLRPTVLPPDCLTGGFRPSYGRVPTVLRAGSDCLMGRFDIRKMLEGRPGRRRCGGLFWNFCASPGHFGVRGLWLAFGPRLPSALTTNSRCLTVSDRSVSTDLEGDGVEDVVDGHGAVLRRVVDVRQHQPPRRIHVKPAHNEVVRQSEPTRKTVETHPLDSRKPIRQPEPARKTVAVLGRVVDVSQPERG